MIHLVKLPMLTKQRLSEVVDVQMTLLSYAVTEKDLDEGRCAVYLQANGFDDIKQDRSQRIARWIWRSKDRWEKLEKFATGPAKEKQELVERLQHEVQQLSAASPKGLITTFKLFSEASWQESGADFLRRFYEDLNKKLPTCLFSAIDANSFCRQDFLKAFFTENKSLYVCPICDEVGSYISIGNSDGSNSNIYTDVEHYFPQSLYPHFACHPYNLVPICHLCNSAVHGDKDPLEPDKNNPDNRIELQDIVLPYREPGLGSVTRLRIDMQTPTPSFIDLVSTTKENTYKTQIDTLARVYKIPERWKKRDEIDIDKVGETLFRRMRQFLRGSHELPIGGSLESVWPVLQYALYQLVHSLHTKGEEGFDGGDFGKDPYSFAMKWLLVTILNEEGSYLVQNKEDEQDDQSEFHFPLLTELAHWLGQDMNNKDEYIICAEALISMLNGGDMALNQDQAQVERGD